MSVTVKPNHPLSEVVARKLHGISGVSADEQRRMVQRAAIAVADIYDKTFNDLIEASDRVLAAMQEFHDGDAMNDARLYDNLTGACLNLRRAVSLIKKVRNERT